MRAKENLADIPTVRLAALIEDQERLLELVRKEKAELVRMDRSIPAEPSTRPTHP